MSFEAASRCQKTRRRTVVEPNAEVVNFLRWRNGEDGVLWTATNSSRL